MSKNFKHEIEKLTFTYADNRLIAVMTVHDITLEVYAQQDFINRCKQIFDSKIHDCWKFGK